tara:strand:+ start:72 stop:1028 length:957 start_codon:yes stop_codon:yes gene_type:complete
MKVLIVGGAGFIGFHLAKRLSKESMEVHIFDNLSRGKLDKDLKKLIRNKKIKFTKKDLLKQSQIKFTDFDIIFNFAAIVGVENVTKKPNEVLKKNLELQLNCLKIALKQKKLKKFIFSSTSEVYAGSLKHNLLKFPTPENNILCLSDLKNSRYTYMLSKIYGEALCYFSSLPYVVVRFHNIYGPRMGMQHVIPQIIKRVNNSHKNILKVENLNHSRTFCYIDDAVEMLFKIISSNKKNITLNIGNNKPETKIKNLVKIILNITKKKNIKIFSVKSSNHSPIRRVPSISLYNKLYGKIKPIKLSQGILKTFLWYKKNYL